MGFLAFLPLRDWLYIGATVAIVTVSALFIHHERQIGADRVEKVRVAEHARAVAAAASAIAANNAETNRRLAATLETVNATTKLAAAVAADAASAAARNDSLQHQLAAFTAQRRAAAGNPPASPASAAVAGEDPALVLADLLGRASTRATELAEIAGTRAVTATTCERQYDTLKPLAAAAAE